MLRSWRGTSPLRAYPAQVGASRPPILARSMAKVCHVCRKGPAFGHSRSHSMVASKRRFNPNLQKVRIRDEKGAPRRAYVCTRCLKAGKVTKARLEERRVGKECRV